MLPKKSLWVWACCPGVECHTLPSHKADRLLQADVAKEQELHNMVLQQRQALKADMDAAVAQESSRAAAARSTVRVLEQQLVCHQ